MYPHIYVFHCSPLLGALIRDRVSLQPDWQGPVWPHY